MFSDNKELLTEKQGACIISFKLIRVSFPCQYDVAEMKGINVLGQKGWSKNETQSKTDKTQLCFQSNISNSSMNRMFCVILHSNIVIVRYE